MPRADYTFLSWSYLFTLGAMISSFLAGKFCSFKKRKFSSNLRCLVGFVLFEIYFITQAKKYNNEKTFIRHVGNPNQPFVRHGDKDEPPFVRKSSEGDQPFIRRNDASGEQPFIRKSDGDNAFIRRADDSIPEEAFIRRTDGGSDGDEAFIRRANGSNNRGNNYIA